jgi:hypothetical protein
LRSITSRSIAPSTRVASVCLAGIVACQMGAAFGGACCERAPANLEGQARNAERIPIGVPCSRSMTTRWSTAWSTISSAASYSDASGVIFTAGERPI